MVDAGDDDPWEIQTTINELAMTMVLASPAHKKLKVDLMVIESNIRDLMEDPVVALEKKNRQ